MSAEQTKDQFIRAMLRASLPTKPDKQATIDSYIESLRREPGHKLDEPCPPAAKVGEL